MFQPEILHYPWPLIYQHIDSLNFNNHHSHQFVRPHSFNMVNHVDDYHVNDACDPHDIIMDDHVDNYDQFFSIDEETFELPSIIDLGFFDHSILCPQIVNIHHDHELYLEESEGSFRKQNFPYNLVRLSSNPLKDNCEMTISPTQTYMSQNFPYNLEGPSLDSLKDSCEMAISITKIDLSQNFPYNLEGLNSDSLEDSCEMTISATQTYLSPNFPCDTCSPTLSMKFDFSSIQQSLTFPQENMEIENKVILPHLMETYGEALEEGKESLAKEILKCISQKVTPLCESLEKLVFYLSQEVTNHGDYLKVEAQDNFEDAFKAFYQGNLVGKVAHFVAISAIIESSMLEDCDEIHIIDFCIGNGVQWPFLLETLSKMEKKLKLTSIKWSDEKFDFMNFEETKRELYEHAKSCGLKLKVEEKGLEDLVSEIKFKRIHTRSLKKVFLAFNLMISLPHMNMVKNIRKNALDFLEVAKDLIKSCTNNKGIITFGDGDVFEKVKNCSNFKSFFEGNLVHYKALLESIESQFSAQFLEARIACEVLFVAPCVSSFDWLQTWKEIKSGDYLKNEISIEGNRLSKNILMEVKEVLRGSGNLYQARIEGENDNELVLEWKGIQLLRFSSWKN